MKLIPLSQESRIKDATKYFAMVDDEDYDYLMQWKWHVTKSRGNKFYAVRTDRTGEKPKTISLHREVFKTAPSNLLVDHVDRNGLNCQRINLRTATPRQNSQNRTVKKGGTSDYLGVTLHHDKGNGGWKRWLARISYEPYKSKHLGYFPYTPCGEIAAAIAYDEAAIKYYGEFASLNFNPLW